MGAFACAWVHLGSLLAPGEFGCIFNPKLEHILGREHLGALQAVRVGGLGCWWVGDFGVGGDLRVSKMHQDA